MAGPPAPQRVASSVDEARAYFAEAKELTAATIARASSFSDDERHQRVGDEWSTIESLRHLVMVIDAWLGATIKGEDDPFDPIGLPPHFAVAMAANTSIDLDSSPTFGGACVVLNGRLATLGSFVDALTPSELERPIGTHAENVAGGLAVIFDEIAAHNFFMNRDLDAIEAARHSA